MNNAPLVSVVIPTYNRAALLQRAIRSVLAQTVHDFELLIIDDGSYDNTEEIVRGFADARVHYRKIEINGGGSAARNVGIRAARGEYLSLLDSDDEWLPEFLENLLEIFRVTKLPHLGLVSSDHRQIGPDPGMDAPGWYCRIRGWAHDDLMNEMKIVGIPSTWLIREDPKEDRVLFDANLPALQDVDYQLRFSRVYQIDWIAESLVLRHKHRGEHVGNPANIACARTMMLKKYEHELANRPGQLAKLHLRAATEYHLISDRMHTLRHLVRAVRTRPTDLRYLSRLLLVAVGFGPAEIVPSFVRRRRRKQKSNAHA